MRHSPAGIRYQDGDEVWLWKDEESQFSGTALVRNGEVIGIGNFLINWGEM